MLAVKESRIATIALMISVINSLVMCLAVMLLPKVLDCLTCASKHGGSLPNDKILEIITRRGNQGDTKASNLAGYQTPIVERIGAKSGILRDKEEASPDKPKGIKQSLSELRLKLKSLQLHNGSKVKASHDTQLIKRRMKRSLQKKKPSLPGPTEYPLLQRSPKRQSLPRACGEEGEKEDGIRRVKRRRRGGRGRVGEGVEFISLHGDGKDINIGGKISSWLLYDSSSDMQYKQGEIIIGKSGLYFVYAQLFFFFNESRLYLEFGIRVKDGSSLYSDFDLFSQKSPSYNPYRDISNLLMTKHIGGLARFSKGTRIFVYTGIMAQFKMLGQASSFGAFLIREDL